MQIRLKNPTTIILPQCSAKVMSFLTYEDESAKFMLNRLREMRSKGWLSAEQYEMKSAKLNEEIHKCLVTFDAEGNACTLSGLAYSLHKEFGWEMPVASNAQEWPRIAWKNKPEHQARYYQSEAVEALLRPSNGISHGAISLPTGAGKSRVILDLIKSRPVKTIVMAPLTDIADQLYKDLVYHFGQQYVGKYNSKKSNDKLITVATVQGLTRCIPGSPAFQSLAKCQSVIVDESHTIAAESFKKVCLNGVAQFAVNRWFVSATQVRGDGSGLLLKGIIGEVVYKKDFMELADQGFLKKLKTHIFTVPPMMVSSTDAKTEIRNNFYRNTHIAQIAAKVASASLATGRPCVILIDEYEQFSLLEKYITVPFMFAHGTVPAEVRKTLNPEHWSSDNKLIVEKFNSGKCMCLIGTTAVSTGVDIKPTATLINWQGGKSEIKIKQGIGRGTRPSKIHPYLYVMDFIVKDSKKLERYAKERIEIYKEFSDLQTVFL